MIFSRADFLDDARVLDLLLESLDESLIRFAVSFYCVDSHRILQKEKMPTDCFRNGA